MNPAPRAGSRLRNPATCSPTHPTHPPRPGPPRRNLWLALQPEGWSPATHHRYPPQLKEAYLQVALMVARGSKARTALLVRRRGWDREK